MRTFQIEDRKSYHKFQISVLGLKPLAHEANHKQDYYFAHFNLQIPWHMEHRIVGNKKCNFSHEDLSGERDSRQKPVLQIAGIKPNVTL